MIDKEDNLLDRKMAAQPYAYVVGYFPPKECSPTGQITGLVDLLREKLLRARPSHVSSSNTESLHDFWRMPNRPLCTLTWLQEWQLCLEPTQHNTKLLE